MIQKSVPKPNGNPAAKVVVFGFGNHDRPHAAWFPHTQADQARAAAKQLGLNVIEVPNGHAADLVAKLPAGQIHAPGPGMVPTVREDLYEKVVATLNPRGEAGRANRASQSQPTCPPRGTRSSRVTSSYSTKVWATAGGKPSSSVDQVTRSPSGAVTSLAIQSSRCG